MLTLAITLEDFSAAHRLVLGYQGKCAALHGHNYGLNVTITNTKLNDHGFIADITQVKKTLNAWVAEYLDHGTLVSEADEALLTFLKKENQKHYLFPGHQNTTLEFLSQHLYQVFTDLLAPFSVELRCVTVSENRSSHAAYENA